MKIIFLNVIIYENIILKNTYYSLKQTQVRESPMLSKI